MSKGRPFYYIKAKTMKAIIYARVSSREQEETGYSLSAQEKFLREYCDKKSFNISKVFSVSESASGKKQRKIFDEMIQHAKDNNIKIIVCEKTDRLTRTQKDAVIVNEWMEKDSENQVHLPKENTILSRDSKSHEKLIWNVKVSISQFFKDNLGEEVQKGQKEKISQGRFPGKPPLGYKNMKENGKTIQIVDEEKAPFIQKMFKYYATGNYSLKKLVEVMYEEGLRTRNENKVVKSRIADYLSDPFYCGKIRWLGEVHENGKQKQIISEDLFKQVQFMLKRKGSPKYGRHFYLFKGLLQCSDCGGTITWERQKGIVYGHCNRYRPCPPKKWAIEEDIKKKIEKEFRKLEIKSPKIASWLRKALKEHHAEEIKYRQNAVSELEKRRNNIEKRLSRLYDDYLDEKIEKDFYEKKFSEYAEGKQDIDSSLQKHSKNRTKYFELGVNFYEISQKAPLLFHKANPEQKRKLIKFIFKEITLNEKKITCTYNPGFDTLARAIKESNRSKEGYSDKNGSKIFEPLKIGSNKAKTGSKYPDFDEQQGRQDLNLQFSSFGERWFAN